eukprot:365227-Chlamydomonas_euryale.AAC.6
MGSCAWEAVAMSSQATLSGAQQVWCGLRPTNQPTAFTLATLRCAQCRPTLSTECRPALSTDASLPCAPNWSIKFSCEDHTPSRSV